MNITALHRQDESHYHYLTQGAANMRSLLERIYHALWTIACLLTAILVFVIVAANVKAEEGKIVVEVAGVKKEYNALEYKVVKSMDICTPAEDPCLERRKIEKEAIRDLHRKLKFECPPCRKCAAENAEIARLKTIIQEQRIRIVSLEQLMARPPNEKVIEKEKTVFVDREVPVMKRHVFTGYAAYADDGLMPTPYLDEDGYISAETYQSLVGGAGYTYFLNDSIGIGVFGMAGQIQRVIGGSISLAL
jgi:hypothetical protein